MKEYKLYTKEKLYTLGYLTIIMEIALLYILYFDVVQKVFPAMFLKETIATCYIFYISATMFAIYSVTNMIMYLVHKARNKNNEILEEAIKSDVKPETVVE